MASGAHRPHPSLLGECQNVVCAFGHFRHSPHALGHLQLHQHAGGNLEVKGVRVLRVRNHSDPLRIVVDTVDPWSAPIRLIDEEYERMSRYQQARLRRLVRGQARILSGRSLGNHCRSWTRNEYKHIGGRSVEKSRERGIHEGVQSKDEHVVLSEHDEMRICCRVREHGLPYFDEMSSVSDLIDHS
ncbi:hypothetical protein PMAYCL1PPCAC_15704 [Pristionchus mayeri]|uniref:Uncharacterized protein n=1 Tax=Pristionchus mayeri TaxID=1317129 RepID=A0AAN5HYG6_9BILA|nr:hypothetical protein PMAYCL1PPCAC_15704 [Pristionchus mayeri]